MIELLAITLKDLLTPNSILITRGLWVLLFIVLPRPA